MVALKYFQYVLIFDNSDKSFLDLGIDSASKWIHPNETL